MHQRPSAAFYKRAVAAAKRDPAKTLTTGQFLRYLMQEQNISVDALAQQLGYKPDYVANMLNNGLYEPAIAKMAYVTGTTPDFWRRGQYTMEDANNTMIQIWRDASNYPDSPSASHVAQVTVRRKSTNLDMGRGG